MPVEILLIEDYEPDVKYLFLLLRKHGIANKVHVVSDGLMALDFIFCRNAFSQRINEPLPAAVLLDIRIPKLNGLEILRQVKANPNTREVPVVMLTGSIFPEELETCKSLGASDCIEKPVRFEDLKRISGKLGFSWALISSEQIEKGTNESATEISARRM